MEVEVFVHQIQSLRERFCQCAERKGLVSLHQNVNQLPLLPQNCLKEVCATLEELQVAQEDLLQQNEELAATRRAVEVERQRYQDLFDFAPDAYLVTDADGTIQEANCAAAIVLNISQQFLVGKALASFVPRDERQTFRSRLNQLSKKISSVQEWKVRLCPRNGEPFNTSLRVAAFQNREHESISLRWILRDITVAKQAEEALQTGKQELKIRVEERTAAFRQGNCELCQETIDRQRAEEIATEWKNRYEAALDLSGKVFCEWNPHTDTSTYSGNSEKILGYSLEEITGALRNWAELIHPSDRNTFNQQIEQSIANKEPFHLEYRMRRKDGSYIFVQDDRYFLLDEAGEAVSLLGFVCDISTRKHLEAELGRREQELSDFVNNGAIGLHWVGADGYILWANQAELELLGYSQEDYIGHHISEFHADKEVIDDIFRRLTANETLHDYEARLLCKDGSIKYVLIDSNVFWKDDQFIHTRCFTRDITKSKQAEQQLRENEERFRSLSACSPVGILLTDVEGRCTYTNPRCQAICGFTLEESLGEGWSQSIHPEDRHRVFADWSQTTREGQEYSDEFRIQTKDTRVRWVHIRSSPMFSDTGELIGHVGTVEDISDRKQAEVRIAESENRWRTIIETEPECVKLVATDGTLLHMNAAGLAMIEAPSADAVIGQSVYSLIAPEHREAFVALNESVCQGNRDTLEFELIGLRGARRWMETHAVSLPNESDGTLVHLAITRDITVRKQAEEELRQLNSALENAVEGISRLDSQGRYIAVNKAYASTRGYQPEEMIGMAWQVTVHPDDLQKLVDAYQQMLKAGKVEVEARGVRKDGSIFYKQVVMVAAYDSRQQFIGHHCFAKDISDRKQAEKALKLAKQELEIRVEERTAELRVANNELHREVAERKRAEVELEESLSLLRGTLEATAEGIIVSQKAAYIATCNQKFIEMWGIPESVIASREIKQLLPLIVAQLKDPECFMRATLELFAQPDAEAYGIIELNDGRIFERYSLPQRIGGNIVGRVCCFRDITERKRAEVELQRSEQKYRNLFHNSLVGMFRNTLTDGTVLDANAAILKMFGYDSYEGVNAADVYVNLADREIVKQQLLEKGFVEDFEAHVRRKDGSVFWVSYSGRLYPEEGYLEGVMIDITERKIAEEALHKAKQELEIRVEERTAQLRQAIEQLQSEIEERKIAQEGLQQSEARFREVAYREALLNRFANLIRNSLDLDTILETAVRELHNRLEIDLCLFSWFYSDGTPSGWKVVKEAKNPAVPSLLGLEPLEKWYSFSCKLVNQEVCQVDNVTESDCAMQQMLLPYGTAAMLSLPIHTQSGELGAITCCRLVSSRSWTDEEMELLQAVANQLAIAINQAQLYEQSRIAANIAQTKATELEVALRQLQQAQAQLVQSEKMSSLGQLVAGVAHEINNPLSFIHGNLTHVNQYAGDLLELVQLYQECYPNSAAEIQALIEEIDLDFIKEDLPKVLSSMQMGTERIHTIVLSLRNFSRADRTERKWADIHEGLDNTLLILAHRLKAKSDRPGIEVIKEYGDLPKVHCYLGQLNQVFMNILSNAIDALASHFANDALEDGNGSWVMGHGEESSNYQLLITNYQLPTIRIRTEINDSNQVIIRIADNGSGMTQEVQQRLFDPFFTTKPVGHGTGLGMSISYQIVVERHGGQLQCISAPGQGTEFLINIPIQQ